MKYKVRLFILGHSLFKFYSCVYVFSFRLFSNISQTVLGSSRRRFCRKYLLVIKTTSITEIRNKKS